MDQFELIRTASRVYGKSIRQIGRETGHHRVTIRKALAGKEPQYRRQEKPRAPVMDPVAKIVEQWLLGDRQRPRKQRHTARRVYTRLLEEHEFTGAEVTVRRWVREWKAAHGWGPDGRRAKAGQALRDALSVTRQSPFCARLSLGTSGDVL